MKSDLSLYSRKRPVRVVRRNLVVEAVKYPLELRDDHILVIAGIADYRTPFQPVSLRYVPCERVFIPTPGQVPCIRVGRGAG